MLSAALPLFLAQTVSAHICPFAQGMYCLNGVSGTDINAEECVNPIYQMNYDQYWMHANTGCLNSPPKDGVFLELPAGGEFTVEMASNQAFTSLSYGARQIGTWPDNQNHDDYEQDRSECIQVPNLHAQNHSMAAGTAFAISYTSDITQVNEDNLVVFTVAYNTPWHRVQSYSVPADMPACPDGGCICAFGWIPNGCGQANMYMHPYKCKVTGASGTAAVGAPQSPEWCEDDESKCVSGPKKFMIWNQNEGNNVQVSGYDSVGAPKIPVYNYKMGFKDGAQNDIFTGGSTGSSGSSNSDQGKSTEPSADSGSNDSTSSDSGSADSNSSADSGSAESSASEPAPTSSPEPAPAYTSEVAASPSPEPAATSSSSASAEPAATSSATQQCRRRRRRALNASGETPLGRASKAHRRHHVFENSL
ncbi:hypothetical protein CYLTODRAFT_413158 [Cylindrobasidium torrendii FP15055 ss-10]|uniref:Lytic polysaccharide monooxygenase n=1 Tax=Cylindrobasidium torrendii FP15055 ss-10 TaxID=1314674 RepID=A0A0D7B3C3_9AGAR|nr:hypothetical protein CYLTODRAFT_413158 [Cylindrobasidium torrendii FP15055 ss-10]